MQNNNASCPSGQGLASKGIIDFRNRDHSKNKTREYNRELFFQNSTRYALMRGVVTSENPQKC